MLLVIVETITLRKWFFIKTTKKQKANPYIIIIKCQFVPKKSLANIPI